jgi:hypothetical protein
MPTKAYSDALRPSSRTSVGPSRTSRGFPAGYGERFETKGPCSKPRIAHGPWVFYPPLIRVVTPGPLGLCEDRHRKLRSVGWASPHLSMRDLP